MGCLLFAIRYVLVGLALQNIPEGLLAIIGLLMLAGESVGISGAPEGVVETSREGTRVH